jgi:hypothetical protein
MTLPGTNLGAGPKLIGALSEFLSVFDVSLPV